LILRCNKNKHIKYLLLTFEIKMMKQIIELLMQIIVKLDCIIENQEKFHKKKENE